MASTPRRLPLVDLAEPLPARGARDRDPRGAGSALPMWIAAVASPLILVQISLGGAPSRTRCRCSRARLDPRARCPQPDRRLLLVVPLLALWAISTECLLAAPSSSALRDRGGNGAARPPRTTPALRGAACAACSRRSRRPTACARRHYRATLTNGAFHELVSEWAARRCAAGRCSSCSRARDRGHPAPRDQARAVRESLPAAPGDPRAGHAAERDLAAVRDGRTAAGSPGAVVARDGAAAHPPAAQGPHGRRPGRARRAEREGLDGVARAAVAGGAGTRPSHGPPPRIRPCAS